jgi:uncharacterized membrane protein YhhN
MKKIIYALFFISALLFIFSLYIKNDVWGAISKPLPLIALLLLLKPNNAYNRLIFTGFIFSLFGDVFLLKIVDNFILGLASFLIAHVFYIFAFLKRNAYAKWLISIPFYLLALGLSGFFYPYLGELMFPVYAYIFVIMTMVWRSFAQITYNKWAFLAFLGAVLFAFSDSCIAFNKFYKPFEYASLITITSYWAGQFLIFLSTFDLAKNGVEN